MVFIAVGTPAIAIGDSSDADLALCINHDKGICQKKSRLTAYQPNTVAWEMTDDDNDSLEVNYSFKYLLTRPDCSIEKGNVKVECINGWDKRGEWFLTYTGKFDFYMGTRPSGPVVNRTNNPGIHWRLHKPSFAKWASWLDIGLEHRSNGQVTEYDLKNTNGDYIADVKWKEGDRAYIDGISRSSNYFLMEVKKSLKAGNTRLSFYASGKAYFTDESLVTWGRRKDSGDRIWDYDMLKFIFVGNNESNKKWIPDQIEYSVEYTIGAHGFNTDSLNASLYFPYVYGKRTYFPINFIKVHVGPMSELSNYTESQTSIYIGIKLNPKPMF